MRADGDIVEISECLCDEFIKAISPICMENGCEGAILYGCRVPCRRNIDQWVEEGEAAYVSKEQIEEIQRQQLQAMVV